MALEDHPAGTIAVPCADLARYHAFTVSMLGLEVPADSWFAVIRSMDVTSTLNSIIREMTGEWVWFQGDDHHFNADTLVRLLDHNVDVVVPMMCKKAPPFSVVCYDSEEIATGPDGREYPAYHTISLEELAPTGLRKVYAAGSGGMLVRKHVLDKIGDPWFENSVGTVVNDDLEFCRKIREAGYDIWLDPETKIGHVGHNTVYMLWRENEPGSKEGRWGLAIDFGGPGTNRVWLTKDAIESFDASKLMEDDGTTMG